MKRETSEVGGDLPVVLEIGLRADNVDDQVGIAILLEFCDSRWLVVGW